MFFFLVLEIILFSIFFLRRLFIVYFVNVCKKKRKESLNEIEKKMKNEKNEKKKIVTIVSLTTQDINREF